MWVGDYHSIRWMLCFCFCHSIWCRIKKDVTPKHPIALDEKLSLLGFGYGGQHSHFLIKKWKKDASNVVIGVNYRVVSIMSWYESICNPEMGITRIREPLMIIASFQRWIPWTDMDKPTLTYLPQSKEWIPPLPQDCLAITRWWQL